MNIEYSIGYKLKNLWTFEEAKKKNHCKVPTYTISEFVIKLYKDFIKNKDMKI